MRIGCIFLRSIQINFLSEQLACVLITAAAQSGGKDCFLGNSNNTSKCIVVEIIHFYLGILSKLMVHYHIFCIEPGHTSVCVCHFREIHTFERSSTEI